MSKLSFTELKRKNEEAAAAQQEEQAPEDNATDELEELEEDDAEETGELEPELDNESDEDGDLDDDEEESDEGEGELDAWMNEGDASKGGKEVPLKAHVKMKHKLKGKLEVAEDENAGLKREIAELKQMVQGGGQQPQQQQQQQQAAPQVDMPVRPKRSDYQNEWGDLDEDKYDAAVDDWYFKRTQTQQQQQHAEAQQSQAQKKQLEAMNQTVDTHYGRAEELVNSGKLKAENYQRAESTILRRLEADVPGGGDETMKALITQVDAVAGDKSALVMYKLGADANALEAVLSGFKTGGVAAGISAIARISGDLKSPAKKLSKAKKPTKQISGDKTASASVKKLQRQVQAARKKNDAAGAIRIKREAKAKGIDTTDW